MVSSTRLALALKRLDRWREVSRCFAEFEKPMALLGSYIGLSQMAMPALVKHRSGLQLRVDEFGDVEAIWQIFLRQVYDVRATDRVIVDAGGNVGLFTCYALWRAPHSEVLTIEPFPTTVERLKQHLTDNRLSDRVSVLDRALTAAPGEVVMSIDAPSSQQKHVLHNPTQSATVLRVPSVTLSDAVAGLPDQIDLLKMDIEGSEFEVLLRSSHETLRRFLRINVEHHEPPGGTSYTKAALIAHLKDAGFRVRQHAGESHADHGILHCEQ